MKEGETPSCAICQDEGSWLVAVRLDDGEVVKACPECMRQLEQNDFRRLDWSDIRHGDNVVRVMPAETRIH